MQSVHHSRARILFEVLCAFGISASWVGAWLQTYASAMLAAAAIAALYGLVHAFDMIRRKPASVAAAPIEAAPEAADADDTVIRSWPLPATGIDEPKSVERPPAKAPVKKRRASKAAKPARDPEVARIVPETLPARLSAIW